MRSSLFLLPSLALALPVAQLKWPSFGSSSLSSTRENSGSSEGGSRISGLSGMSWLEKLRGGSQSSNYHSGYDGTWDVLEPTEKAKPAKADTEKAKPAPAKPAKEEVAPAEEEAEEEAAPAEKKTAPTEKKVAPTEKKNAPAEKKVAPAEKKSLPAEEEAVPDEETVEEEAAPAAPAPKPKPAKVAPKEEAKSEFIGTGFNPGEPKKNRGWFGWFGRH